MDELLGKQAIDLASGLKGTITGVAKYLHTEDKVLLKPKSMDIPAVWLSVLQVKYGPEITAKMIMPAS